MSLSDGRERWGGVPEAAQGGVLLSSSDACEVQAETTTGIGLEGKNELNRIFPSLLPADISSTLSLILLDGLAWILLCSSCIFRREVHPFVILRPPHAGPSFLGVGGGATSFGVSSLEGER